MSALPFPCATAPATRTSCEDCPDKRGTLIATVAGSSLAFVVGSIVNVALPAMQDEFATGPTGAQWIVNAYLLPLGAFVLIGGALGDHYGRKRVFQLGVAIMALSCLLCAVAWSLPVLLLGRAMEGIGAAMIAPTSLAIIADGFSGKARAQAVATWAGAGAAAGALSPLAGGLIVDGLGWRWIFMAIVPVAAATFIVARRAVRESRAPSADCAPLDWLGAGLAAAGLTSLIWALIALPERGATTAVLAASIAGFILTGLFILVEHRKGERAMTPLGVFTSRSFSGLSLMTLFLYMALMGFFVLLPYVMIRELGYSATTTGAAILPFPLILALLSRSLGGTLAEQVGTRAILTIGSLVVAAGFWIFTHVPSEDVNYWRHIFPALLILALGSAASIAPLTSAVLASAGDRYTGVASGINNATSRIAGLIATALLGLVLIGWSDDLSGELAVAAWAGVALAFASAFSAWAMIGPKAVGATEGDAP